MFAVLHDDPGADHHQHCGVDVGTAQAIEQKQFDGAPHDGAEQHRKCKRSKEIDAKKHHQRIHAVGAECVKFTVREIDHTHDAEYESEPDPQQRISAAEDRRIQEMLK